MRRVVTLGLLLALAGCGGGEEPTNTVAPKPTPTPAAPKLGGIDLDKPLRVSGPGTWEIRIAPGTITYVTAAEAPPTDFYPVSPKLAGGRAVFETKTPEAEAVTITLTAKTCAAGKQALPLAAEARIGARILHGCAGPAPVPARPVAGKATPAR
jgi:uncharacterized membrane protein